MSQVFYDDEYRTSDKRKRVMLATTSYGNPDCAYTHAIARSREFLHNAAIDTEYVLLQGNCHVDDARNTIVRTLLMSDCDELVFIDADVSWEPKHLLTLCEYNEPVVCGVYPYRREDKQNELPVRMLPSVVPENGLFEIEGGPTGFMKIQRHVLTRLAADADKYDDHEAVDLVPIIFERTYEHGVRFGGDLSFCNKWRRTGGRVMCDPDLMLGHVGRAVIKDSFSAVLRRLNDTTLRYVADKIKEGNETLEDCIEAHRYIDNKWALAPDSLFVAIQLARQSDGPVIEAGSGLSTVLMAAATNEFVYCLEHDRLHAMLLERMANDAGVENIGVCFTPIKDGWYDPNEFDGLPDSFGFGLIDGPPRRLMHGISSRKPFLDHFAVTNIMVDDVKDPTYCAYLSEWAESNGYDNVRVNARSLVLREKLWRPQETLSSAV